MRVCTKDAQGIEYDAAVPVKPAFKDGERFYDQEHCSESPYDVPWIIERQDITHPNMFSVGNAPMYRSQGWDNTPSATYPSEDRMREVQNTLPGTRDKEWGERCSDGLPLSCETSDPVCILYCLEYMVCLSAARVPIRSAFFITVSFIIPNSGNDLVRANTLRSAYRRAEVRSSSACGMHVS